MHIMLNNSEDAQDRTDPRRLRPLRCNSLNDASPQFNVPRAIHD